MQRWENFSCSRTTLFLWKRILPIISVRNRIDSMLRIFFSSWNSSIADRLVVLFHFPFFIQSYLFVFHPSPLSFFLLQWKFLTRIFLQLEMWIIFLKPMSRLNFDKIVRIDWNIGMAFSMTRLLIYICKFFLDPCRFSLSPSLSLSLKFFIRLFFVNFKRNPIFLTIGWFKFTSLLLPLGCFSFGLC